VAEADGRAIGKADLMLQHLGYEGDQTRKHLRNLPLLRRQLEIEPGNLFAWNHLGRVLEALGENEEAEQAYQRAIDTARAEGPPGHLDPLTCLSYGDLVRLRGARGADTSELLAEALSAFPGNCLLLLMEARRLIEQEDYAAALEPLDQILRFDWATDPDDPPAYDAPIVGELPWSNKGLCLFRMGAYAEAAEAYGAAARCAPDDPSYRAKVQLCLARARRSSPGS
jgi:tetratricopeptide (TPR) repeat protein